LTVATCMTCWPKSRWGGVDLNVNLSSGIAPAILSIVALRSVQSFSISAWMDTVCADAAVAAHIANASMPNVRINCFTGKPPVRTQSLPLSVPQTKTAGAPWERRPSELWVKAP